MAITEGDIGVGDSVVVVDEKANSPRECEEEKANEEDYEADTIAEDCLGD
ncbi:hypothetical protein [Halospeciosus flavus]|uniref:Uncharacterized protein n=1 Tax=Halospeciosus flavus TaxID=3032283 RepID=A0ABD5Z6B4_9EURY